MDEERGLAVREAGSDLVAKTERQEPLLYYGGSGSNGDKTAIEYISDMHLLHHVRYYGGDIRKTVDEAARNIRASHADPFYTNWKTGWIAPKSIFLGDVASDRDVAVEFYRRYWLKVAYRQYKEYKARLMESRPSPESARRQANIKRSVKSIDKCISAQKDEFKRLKAKVDKHLSYSRIIAPKGGINGIKAYLASSYYKKRNLPRSARKKILDAAAANEELCRLEGIKANLKDKLALEEPIDLRDFRFDLHRYSPSFDYLGIVILGNHEYVGFPDVDAAVAFYKESLEPLGYAVLQNECIEDDRCVIYGGTGFAAHNERYNATNLVCCDAMTVDRGLFAMAAQGLPGAEAELKEAKARARAYEVEQTRLFVEGYEAARERARKAGKCFICASHYPAEDCLGRIDRDAVYFSGHTHQNRYLRSENAVIYADNQVGYHKRGGFDPRWDMRFKRATTGCARNPYADLADGCYPTTADEYLSFYRFIGEYAGTGKMIRQRCEKNDMHVIKSNGYYGFFLVGENGTSIVNGGKTKRVSTHRDIKWAHDNFDTVVSKYLAALAPLRERQEQVSGELKRLGFSGNIHGLIVDVNFSHHIMVNPADET